MAWLASCAPALPADASIAGRWITYDGDTHEKRSVIEIAVSGIEARGRIVELFLRPGEDPDAACDDCPGEARGRNIRGLQILTLRAEGNGTWRGTVLDPANGHEYRALVTQSADGKHLALRGYALLEVFGRSESWSRAD